MKPLSPVLGRVVLLAAMAVVAFNSIFSGCMSPSGSIPVHNRLTAAEQRNGWKLLFDGTSLAGWRTYRKPEAPKQGWIAENGCLRLLSNGKGGDLVTEAQFTDYD